MADPRRERGSDGEERAALHLQSLGYEVVERNWRTSRGELDLILRSPEGILCFVEVKTAHTAVAGDPGEWITPAKQRRIARLAAEYCARHNVRGECRFDAFLIRETDGHLEHLPGAFLA